MTYSEYIDTLIVQLESLGVPVEPFADLPETVLGRCHYPDEPGGPRIQIGRIASAKTALMTLCHEIGHLNSWYDYSSYDYVWSTLEGREQMAQDYGWDALDALGTDITRDEWDALHTERMDT